ncbi:extracellular calcium-sensing receptor-like [Protopterus annectens]|uniref:extracellular calcium-sensing receptor-like n=1 Tax=Protopterus annectens TaxID=7888 RepID=UPI001CFBB9DC|nr:extracellular calcium-sensing receptor-like [Protopterus annectens]
MVSVPAYVNAKVTGCQLRSLSIDGFTRKGDINIGGIFSVHFGEPVTQIPFTELPDAVLYKEFYFRVYERLLAMVFTIENIQNDLELLPNVTLGCVIYDSYSTTVGAVDGTLRLLTGHGKVIPNYRCQTMSSAVAVIGDALSVTSIPIARLLGLYRFPQISHEATVMTLSDKNQFPSFLRTVPMDLFQSICIAHLVLYFGWTWVGLLSDSSDYGLQGSLQVKEELLKGGACIAFFETIPAVYSEKKTHLISETIKKSSANVIVIFANDFDLYSFMEVTVQNNVMGKVWVASDGWSEPYLFSKNEFLRTLQGTLGILVRRGDVLGFKEYIYNLNPYKNPDDIFLKNFWELVFNCKLQIPDKSNKTLTKELNFCVGNETLQGMKLDFFELTELRNTYNVYNAIYAFAHALHDMISCRHGEGPFDNGSCALKHDFQPWQIPQSLCSESCSAGYRKATQAGQPVCCFKCILCSQGEISNQTDSIECLKCPKDDWPNERQDKCIKKATEFLSYEEPLGSALIAISIFLELTTTFILKIFMKYHHTPVVKANNRELSYLLLFSLMLCFLCSFIFIGRPTHVTCMLRQGAFGAIFTLSISCVLAKTVVVVIAFNASKPNSNLRKYAGPGLPKMLVIFSTSVQIIICVSWLFVSPPFLDENTTSVTRKIIIECNEGSPVAFWCMLSYMGILAVVSLVVAFLSRKLPDSFNEAKFITFSMLVFISVWMSFIPAYLSTQGKYMVAVEIFAIVSSGAGLLLCIFAPKCYIILFRPDMNSRDYLMGKGVFKNGKD